MEPWRLRPVASARVRLAADRRGAVVVMIGLLLVPLMAVTGLVVDMGMALAAQRQLARAADSAAVAAINAARIVIGDGRDIEDRRLLDIMRDAAEDAFAANLAGFDGEIDVTPTIRAGKVEVGVTYRGRSKSLIPILTNSLDISGSVTSTSALSAYVDVNFMVDVSASMGIGATKDDQDRLQGLLGCVFACHVGYPTGQSPYEIASKAGILTRLDVVRAAVSRIMKHVADDLGLRDYVRFGLYTFSSSLTREYAADEPTLFSLIAALLRALKSIVMVTVGGGTDLHRSLAQMSDELPVGGDGTRPDRRQSYLVLMTDGTEHTNNLINGTWIQDTTPRTPTYGYLTQNFDPTYCAPIRQKKVNILILHVKYVIPESAHGYEDMIGHIRSKILPAMDDVLAECAGGKGNVYAAETPAEIDAAIDRIFNRILGTTVLTR